MCFWANRESYGVLVFSGSFNIKLVFDAKVYIKFLQA